MASIIALMFLQDYHPFLLEAIRVSGLGLFPFQAHLRLTWNLFLLTCKLASLHSNSFLKRGAYRFQNNISKILHERSSSNVIINILFDFHHTQLKSCANPSSSAWFSIHSFILSFCMASKYIFSSTLCIQLSLPHLIVHGLAHYIYGQIQWGFTFFDVPIVQNAL